MSPGGIAALCGAIVTVLTLVGMLWRLLSAVVRHIDATEANTAAIATLADSVAENVLPRLDTVERAVQEHDLILSGKKAAPRYA